MIGKKTGGVAAHMDMKTSQSTDTQAEVEVRGTPEPHRPNAMPKWLVPFIAGCSAGIGDTLLNYPPYCLHYRLQRRENLFNLKLFTPKELYRGVVPYAAIIPITCLCDGITDSLVAHGVPKLTATLGAGMFSAVTISAPVGNSIVTNLRLKEERKPSGSAAAIRNIYKNHGLRGFYTGAQSLIMREAIYSSATFYGKGAVQDRLNCGDAMASVVSGTLATIMSQPFDTSATRAQNKPKPVPWRSVVLEMWYEGGVRAFYRGFFLRCYAVIAGIYVMNGISDRVKLQFDK